MDINTVKEAIEEVYTEEGNYFSIDRDTGESWEDAFHRTLPGLPKGCFEIFKKILKEHGYESDDCVEISTEEFAYALCDTYNYQIEEWESDNVFDSPGLDIYVLSFVLSNGLSNDLVYSLNNVYYLN